MNEPQVAAKSTPSRSPGRVLAAAIGVLATGAALGTGEFLAGTFAGAPSPILSVGRQVIDLQPPGAKEFAVSLFGTAS